MSLRSISIINGTLIPQTLMSASLVLTLVTEMPCVWILMVVSPVPVTLDSLVMDSHAVSGVLIIQLVLYSNTMRHNSNKVSFVV